MQLFLYTLLIENVTFFICAIDELKKFSKIAKKIASNIVCKKNPSNIDCKKSH
jgi:hypothetical protein